MSPAPVSESANATSDTDPDGKLPAAAIQHRLRAVLIHVPFYSIEGTARLAHDVGVSHSTVSRILRSKGVVSYCLVERIARAISQHCGADIQLREIFTTDGTYPTASACRLMGCKGCFPHEAWREDTETLRPAWMGKRPGDWSINPQPDQEALKSPPGTQNRGEDAACQHSPSPRRDQI